MSVGESETQWAQTAALTALKPYIGQRANPAPPLQTTTTLTDGAQSQGLPGNNSVIVSSVLRHKMYFVCVCGRSGRDEHIPPSFWPECLHFICDVLNEYLTGGGTGGRSEVFSEDLIADNLPFTFKVIAELFDCGMPVVNEVNLLKEFLYLPSVLAKLLQTISPTSSSPILTSQPLNYRMLGGYASTLPRNALSTAPWKRGRTYNGQNEILFDLIEDLELVVDCRGRLKCGWVKGGLWCTSKLSNNPNVILQLTSTPASSSLQTDSFCVHPCINIKRWKEEGMLCFSPPDGRACIMNYMYDLESLLSHRNTRLPIYAKPQLIYGGGADDGTVTMQLFVGTNIIGGPGTARNVKTSNISAKFNVPKYAKDVKLDVNYGKAYFDKTLRHVVWTIGSLTTQDKTLPLMTATIKLEQQQTFETRSRCFEGINVNLEFCISSYTVSGLKPSRVQIINGDNDNSSPFKGIRMITRSSSCTFRT